MSAKPKLDNQAVEDFLEDLKRESPAIHQLFDLVVRSQVTDHKKIKEILENFAREQMRAEP